MKWLIMNDIINDFIDWKMYVMVGLAILLNIMLLPITLPLYFIGNLFKKRVSL